MKTTYKKVIVKSFKEGEYTFEELAEILKKAIRDRNNKEKHLSIEFLTHYPILDKEGNVIGIEEGPAVVNFCKLIPESTDTNLL